MTRTPKKSPAFQFYPSNFLGSPKVRAMKAAQVGVYWLLCCIEWESDGFTLEDAQECAESVDVDAAQFAEMWQKLSRCFVERNGRFFSPRLNQERAKQGAWRRKCSKGGKLSAEKRRKDSATTVAQEFNTPSLSPTLSPVTTTTAGRKKRSSPVLPPYDALFEEAWAAYPKRPGNSKAAAWEQWLARLRDETDPLDMLEGSRAYATQCGQERTEPKYVMHASKFFGKGKHFEADRTPVASPDPTPAEVMAKVLGTTPDRIEALWAEEDQGLAIARRKGVA